MDDRKTTSRTDTAGADADAARTVAMVNLIVALAILANAERAMRRRRVADCLTVFGLTLLVATLYRVLVHVGAAPAFDCVPSVTLP